MQLERGFAILPATPDSGHPAGWAGLSRRGGWDRLVTSEWALSEAAPEEFVRRASEGELSYWQRAQESQNRGQTVWVWVDVGPDQLGACRLVQLAVLLLLQHLCQASGGQFCWGMIQTPQKGYDRLGPEEVKTYLRGRSLHPGRRPPEAPSGMQSWCIGSPGWLTQVPAGYQKVGLEQISPDCIELQYRQRRLPLQMPPRERALRLLRDPLGSPKPPPLVPAPEGEGRLRFSQCGRKLLVVDDHTIHVVPLPASPADPPGKVRHFRLRRRGKVLGVSWERHALYVAQEYEGYLEFYRQNPARDYDDDHLRVRSEQHWGDELGCCWPGSGGWYLWLDDCLWKADQDGMSPRYETAGGRVLGSRALLVRADLHQIVDLQGKVDYQLPQQPFRKAYLCSGWGQGITQQGHCIALQHEDSRWTLLSKKGTATLQCQGNVVGVVQALSQGEPALLVQHAHHYVIQGADWSEVLDVGFLLAESVVHPDGVLAYRTQGGQIRCYSVPTKIHLWAGPK